MTELPVFSSAESFAVNDEVEAVHYGSLRTDVQHLSGVAVKYAGKAAQFFEVPVWVYDKLQQHAAIGKLGTTLSTMFDAGFVSCIVRPESASTHRRFVLVRTEEPNPGEAVTDVVAQGVQYPGDVAVVRWVQSWFSPVIVYNEGMAAVKESLAGDVFTKIEWLDD